MNTCGTCKYFGELIGRYLDNDGDDEDEDDVEQPNTKLHECTSLKHLNADSKKLNTAVAGVIDGSGYHAVLCVSEEFGCNQWAQKTGQA